MYQIQANLLILSSSSQNESALTSSSNSNFPSNPNNIISSHPIISSILVAITLLIYYHFYHLPQRRINFYTAQGITCYPGARTPFLGNSKVMTDYSEERQKPGVIVEHQMRWIVKNRTKRYGQG